MISERLARGAGACLVLLPFSASLLAQEEIALWQVTPRASIAQIYSDNIEQAPRGEENSEPVTDLNVGFRLNRDGPRGSGRFDYNLQGVAFWDESDANDVFQQFTGAGDVALAPERVFVEGSVDFRQRAVDRDGSLSDNLTLERGPDRCAVPAYQPIPDTALRGRRRRRTAVCLQNASTTDPLL
jgi:hypothetical protein